MCEPPTFSLHKIYEPLRCSLFSSRVGTDLEADNNDTFIVDGLLTPSQASLRFPGEAYKTTRMTMEQPRQTSGENTDNNSGRSFHALYVRFEHDNNRLVAAVGAASTEEENTFALSNGHKQLAPIDERQLTKHGADAITHRSAVGIVAAPATGASPGDSKGSSSMPRGSFSPSRSLSPTNAVAQRGSTFVQREEEYVPMLKAVGRAAMVGFHAGLAGAMRLLTWGPGELVLVANDMSSTCSTLREAFVSGSLYRVTGKINTDGGRGRPKPLEDEKSNSAVVVDRMLELARQTAAAISHCHSAGVSARGWAGLSGFRAVAGLISFARKVYRCVEKHIAVRNGTCPQYNNQEIPGRLS